MSIWLITPILDVLRCYNKRKIFNFELLLRTPILYYIYYQIFYLFKIKDKILLTLIIERWHMLLYKTLYYNNNYEKNII